VVAKAKAGARAVGGAVPEVTWERVLSRRMERHFLDGSQAGSAEEVAARVGGVHAQVMSAAALAIGLRAPGVSTEAVRRGLERDKRLVKTWAARGTLHLLPSEALPEWVAAMSVRRNHTKGAWHRYFKMTAADVEALFAALPAVLGRRRLTREELAAAVAKETKRPHLEERLLGSWGAVLKPAAARGLVCFGPNEGRNVTFVSPPAWLGKKRWSTVSEDEGLAHVARVFLDAYGPGTAEAFARWLGLEPRPCKELFTRLAAEETEDGLVAVDLEGERVWTTRGSVSALTENRARRGGKGRERVVRLLPAFDPYVVGALGHLERLLPSTASKALRGKVSRAQGWISATLLVDGQLAGTWTHEMKGSVAQVSVEPFGSVAAALKREVMARAEEMALLLGADDAEVSWS
jgi:hypothetical protein